MADCLRLLISVSSNANPEMLKKLVPALRRLRFLIEESYGGENDGSSDVGLQLHQMSYMLRIGHLLQAPGFERWLLNQVWCFLVSSD
jgi:hypothetical protein